MKLDQKQIIALIILVGGLALGVYILFFDAPEESPRVSYSFSGDTSTSGIDFSADTTNTQPTNTVADLSAQKPIPSMADLPENLRIAFQILDRGVDSAYAMPPGPGKTKLLAQIKSRLDTLYGNTENPFSVSFLMR